METNSENVYILGDNDGEQYLIQSDEMDGKKGKRYEIGMRYF